MRKLFTSLFIKYIIIFVCILFVTNVLASLSAWIFFYISGFPDISDIKIATNFPLTFAIRTGIITLLLGTVFIFIASRIVTKPIKKLSSAVRKVAAGDLNAFVETSNMGHDEVSELAMNFNLMTKALSKNEYLHKDFVSNVSHEFKTPITAIQGYAQLLANPSLSNEKRIEYSNIIISQTSRLSNLSSNLLRLSEIENDSFQPQFSSFSLSDQIQEVVILLEPEWSMRNVEIDLELEKLDFVGDKQLVFQVWLNIIDNAIKYNINNNPIKIKLSKIQDNIVVTIKDQGIGMTNEQTLRAFDRFYTADSSRSNKNTGLGLSIAKKIVEIHKGEISIESKVDVGTTFKIVLPIRDFVKKNLSAWQ